MRTHIKVTKKFHALWLVSNFGEKSMPINAMIAKMAKMITGQHANCLQMLLLESELPICEKSTP